MKQLIIAEKPSLMRTIMHALSTQGESFVSRDDGEYFESDNYIATAQFGHLLELKMPEEYTGRENLGAWRVENLPFFPDKYEYNVRKDAKKRYNTIKRLIADPNVGRIIHAGDPDREGQCLVQNVLRQCGNKKPVIRPQLKALTDEAILEALRTARDNAEYKNLFNEGMTRMCFDWDFGINLSQYVTVKTNARPALNIGRVIGAIVTEIYNRDTEIEMFVPDKYYKVVSDVEGGFKLTSKERFDKTQKKEAEEYAARLQAGESIVTDLQERNVTKRPPKLFSQTTLQAVMSKRFGYKPDKTLELAQSLYEKGLTSYPRTNTEFIAEAEKDAVRDVINKINRDGYLEFRDSKTIFDDTKIDGHSAITVTGKRPADLSDDEMTCYKVILYRFMAVFCKEPCIYSKTTVVIDNPLEQFKVSGEILLQEGWQKFEPKKKAVAKNKTESEEDDDETEQMLPKVSVGDCIDTDFKAVAAETKPPKHYTVETLGKWMENPFRKDDASDDEDYENILAGLEIGTVATRASILEKATDKGYISLKKKAYHIEPRGRFLVEASEALGIDFSAQMTANMGRQLKSVGRGEVGIMDVLTANRAEVSRVIAADRTAPKDSEKYGGRGDYVPKEKTDAAVYEPTGEEVAFSREFGGHRFTDDEVAALLRGEEISFQAVSSRGKAYTAEGRLEKQKYKPKGASKDVTFWGFKLNERDFPTEFLGHKITEEEKEILLSKVKKEDRMVYMDDLWSAKKRKTFAAHVYWDKKQSRLEMVFKRKKGK